MPNSKKERLFCSETCTLFVLSIMKVSSRSSVSSAMTIELISVVVAIAIMLLAPNITIINAQQLTNQPPAVAQNGVTLFQSTEDSFRLQVPEGWIIHDVNNTGSTLSEESTQGYGILAQLCPQEEEDQEQEQAAAALSNVTGSGDAAATTTTTNTTTTSCQGSEGDVIHIVRYPDLDARLQGVVSNNVTNVTTTTTTTNNNNNLTIDNILSYHMQKLEQVGYNRIETVVNTDTILNVTNPQTNQTIATVPAKFVEMTYNTASAPNETRQGYFILTATDATHPNLGMTKGYSVFYEGTSTAAGAPTAATIQETTAAAATPSGSLAPTPLPVLVRQMFESFELIAAPEVIQDMLAAQSEQAQEVEEPTNPLTVEITSSETEEGEAIAPATFEFEADIAGGIEPYTISWSFGDGGTEESDDDDIADHTFDEAGSYDVGVTVTDSGGQSASDSVEITVEEAPPAEEEPVEVVEEVEEAPPAEEEPVEVEEVEEAPPAEEEEEDNNLGSDDLIDVDEIIDDFTDDLLGRLGIDN
jgi:PKD repeat protein